MKSYLLLPFLISFILSSCFIADDIFLEEEEPELTLPLEVIVKDSIYHYILSQKGENQRYLSYGYEPLRVIVPEEIKIKERWENRQNVLGFDPEMVNSKIAYYDSIVKARNLSRKISMVHTFSLREIGDTVLDLQSINFILSNELSVLDFVPSYMVNLSLEEEKVFAKFNYDTPILKAYSYSESQSLSKKFYGFFKQELSNKENSIERGLFLRHIIEVVTLVDEKNEFDVQQVSQSLLIDHMKKNRQDIIDYNPIDFSPLYEINEEENLVGYYFFHTFKFKNVDEADKLSVYVKFNQFYEVERIIETDQPYEAFEE